MKTKYTADLKFLELCDEIDYWKDVAQKEKEDATHWRNEYNHLLNSQLNHSKEMVGTMLKGLLNKTI